MRRALEQRDVRAAFGEAQGEHRAEDAGADDAAMRRCALGGSGSSVILPADSSPPAMACSVRRGALFGARGELLAAER